MFELESYFINFEEFSYLHAYRHGLLHDERLLARGHPLRVLVLLLEPNAGVDLSLENEHHHGPLKGTCVSHHLGCSLLSYDHAYYYT